jgi:hypothetical protein
MTSKTLLSSGKSSKEHDKIAYIKTALFLARNHQPLYIKIPNPVQGALSDRGQCTRDPVQVHKKSHGQKEIFVGDRALPVAPLEESMIKTIRKCWEESSTYFSQDKIRVLVKTSRLQGAEFMERRRNYRVGFVIYFV